ncbi:MAG: NAD-dependent epimerase/dehydratase family protein [Candidatus Krumholzibacteriia bacterium]
MSKDVLLVTGAAGFIGSTLTDRLLRDGHRVRGVDSLTDYYDPAIKRSNMQDAMQHPDFEFVEGDLADLDLPKLLQDVSCCFHLAAQAGVRASWGRDFAIYIRCNIDATQKLLEAARDVELPRLVYSSSSSVYGNARQMPMSEDAMPSPVSPYGVTKLSGEQLCNLYYFNYDLSSVSLRYFTVYGPRQRPDMAFHKFIRAGIVGSPIEIYGDGEQTRDFTFVDDAVEANLAAMGYPKPHGVFNVGGGATVTVKYVIEIIESSLGKRLQAQYRPKALGDVNHTHADTRRAAEELGFRAQLRVEAGIPQEVAWVRQLYESSEVMELSFVIPLYNEVESLQELKSSLDEVVSELEMESEYIFVDDGSADGSLDLLRRLHRENPKRVKVLSFRRNQGKSAALAAGFQEPRGEFVVTLDADLQDDPDEVPRLLDELRDGADLVCGWKRRRSDPWTKRMPSRLFNFVTSVVSRVKLHDFNTGLKAYRGDVVRSISVYGELHRFIPVLAAWQGFTVSEIPVRHRARKFGASKFGPARFLHGFFDLITVMFLTRRSTTPLYFFGGIALAFVLGGLVIDGWFLVRWMLGEAMRVRPLLLLGIGLIIVGIQIGTMGLLAEMLSASRAERRSWSFRERLL